MEAAKRQERWSRDAGAITGVPSRGLIGFLLKLTQKSYLDAERWERDADDSPVTPSGSAGFTEEKLL